ncbi:MAG: lactate utilization protein [Bacteroidota bacterium]|nr:lactate utilization protein [Bacteroidota bacterium]
MYDLSELKKQLEKNNFETYISKDPEEAKSIFFEKIFKIEKPASLCWGDSLTLYSTHVLDELKQDKNLQVIDPFDSTLTWKEQISRRKKAFTCDMFLTGTNAVTAKGQLVNLDMVGNRVAALTFGPRKVVLFIGKNKIVKDLDEAFQRVKKIAPLNALRHPNMKTPCQKTLQCIDCKSPQRLCNTWTITEKSFPKNRIKIILIDQELGL